MMEKKRIAYGATLTLAAGLLLTGCLFEEENLFDQPAATRLNNAVTGYHEMLTQSEYGWVMEFFPSDGSMGGYVLTARFDGGMVDMATEMRMSVGGHIYEPGETITSAYSVKSEQSVMLSFDSENPFIHYFSTPTATSIHGMQSDFEFVFLGTSETRDSIFLRGKKYEQDMLMVKLDRPAAKYLERTVYVRNAALLMRRDTILIEGRKYPICINREGVRITDTDRTLVEPCIITATALKLSHPVKLATGYTLKDLRFDGQTGEFRAEGAVVPCPSLHEQLLHPRYTSNPRTNIQWYFQIHQEKVPDALTDSLEYYEMSDTLFALYKRFDQSDISGTFPLIASVSYPGTLSFCHAGFNPSDVITLYYLYYAVWPDPAYYFYRCHLRMNASDGPKRRYSFSADFTDEYNARFWSINRYFIQALCDSSPFDVLFDDEVFAQVATFTSTVDPDIWFVLKLDRTMD